MSSYRSLVPAVLFRAWPAEVLARACCSPSWLEEALARSRRFVRLLGTVLLYTLVFRSKGDAAEGCCECRRCNVRLI